jgi:hypothetical protein
MRFSMHNSFGWGPAGGPWIEIDFEAPVLVSTIEFTDVQGFNQSI